MFSVSITFFYKVTFLAVTPQLFDLIRNFWCSYAKKNGKRNNYKDTKPLYESISVGQ